MFRDLPRYNETRATALPWATALPSHWRIERAKSIMRAIDVRSVSGDEELLTVSSSRGVIPRTSATVSMFKAESYVGHKLCWPNDLVINSLWAWGCGLGIARHHGIVSTAYGVYRQRNADLEPLYLHELARSEPFQWELQVRSQGVWKSRLQISDERWLDAPLLVPPMEEQTAIVKYLAHANARIDKAIAAKRRLIALLEEQIATRIRAAFERSDDRDSHRLRAFTGRPITGITPPTTESRYFENGTVDWHGPSSFSADLFLGVAARKVADAAIDEGAVRLLRSPSLLVVAIGATCGKSAIVLESTCTNQQVVAFSLDLAKCDPEFIGYQAKALERKWRGSASTATIPMISTEVLRSSPFWLPSLEEQREIAGLISEQRTKKSNAVRRINREITLLREFRTRLVADVVTGQVDVRAIAATLPDAPESFDNAAPALDDELEEVLDESEE